MRKIDPKQTNRAAAFTLWMKAPMPMVTLFKTLDVTHLIKFGRKRSLKFHMLMCWCIGKAASEIEEFYRLPAENALIEYDEIAVNTIVQTKNHSISTCDIPFSPHLEQFHRDYLKLTQQVSDTCEPHNLDQEFMVIGTSALTQTELDGAVNIYAGFYCNPFLIWGRYQKRAFRTLLPISFQFHHTQMDGGEAAQFLERLQGIIKELK